MTTRTMNNHIISKPVKIKYGYWTVVTRYYCMGKVAVEELRESRAGDTEGFIACTSGYDEYMDVFVTRRQADMFIRQLKGV